MSLLGWVFICLMIFIVGYLSAGIRLGTLPGDYRVWKRKRLINEAIRILNGPLHISNSQAKLLKRVERFDIECRNKKITTPELIKYRDIRKLKKNEKGRNARSNGNKISISGAISNKKFISIKGHKKKSLMPRSPDSPEAVYINKVWQDKEAGKLVKKRTPPISQPFEHKFFGTSLNINGRTLFQGLGRNLHRLEIIGDQVFIDNQPQAMNFGDIERIKEVIREARA